ncbi:hypothetical protein PRNP1_011781 [Phytophthora ramorum]
MEATTAHTAPAMTIASFQPPNESALPEEVEALVGSDPVLLVSVLAPVSVSPSSELIGERVSPMGTPTLSLVDVSTPLSADDWVALEAVLEADVEADVESDDPVVESEALEEDEATG